MASGPVVWCRSFAFILNLQISEIKSMPKVELHKHLEGSLRLSTLQELTKKKTGKELSKAEAIYDTPTDGEKSDFCCLMS